GQFYLTRQAKPLGLGHAVWCAKQLVGDEPFAVLLPDVLMKGKTGCMKQMIEVYNQHGGNIISVKETPEEDIHKYGIIDPGEQNGDAIEVKNVIEKPAAKDAPSNLSVAARYILQPEIFAHLEKFECGAGDEIQLTDAMAKLIGQQPFNGVRYEGDMFDCGGRLGFVAANIAYGLDDPDLVAPLQEILKSYN
ncbi:MAG: UTP--glucose-1-phosphate uridylyltransferase, partial [Pseudomonadota bacterium]